jgi:hypothetical protein
MRWRYWFSQNNLAAASVLSGLEISDWLGHLSFLLPLGNPPLTQLTVEGQVGITYRERGEPVNLFGRTVLRVSVNTGRSCIPLHCNSASISTRGIVFCLKNRR